MLAVDVEKLWASIDKMASAVNRSAGHTEQIPEIKDKVDSTREKVLQLTIDTAVTTERVTKIETKVGEGHVCQIPDTIEALKDSQRESSQKIELDIQKGIEQKGRLDEIIKDQSQTEADVADIKKAPRRMFYGLLGVIVVLLSGGLSAAWFLAQLERNVIHEQEIRVEQFKRIESQIKAAGVKSDSTSVKRALEQLEAALETSNGHAQDYNALCVNMQRHEKRLFRGVLMKRGKRLPTSCLSGD